MLLKPTLQTDNHGDEIPARFEPVFFPLHLWDIDVRPLMRFPKNQSSRPRLDYVDRLRSHLVASEIDRAARSDKRITSLSLGAVWGVDAHTASKIMRSYRSGQAAISDTRLDSIREIAPEAWALGAWPWALLTPRSMTPAQILKFVWPEQKKDNPAKGFWSNLQKLRLALEKGSIYPIAQHSRAMLEALPALLSVPAVRAVAVELMDVVHRFLGVLPYPLIEERPRTDVLLRHLLSEGEQAAIIYTQPKSLIEHLKPNLTPHVLGWPENNIFVRYWINLSLQYPTFIEAARNAWKFVPTVESNYQLLDKPEMRQQMFSTMLSGMSMDSTPS